MRIITLFVLTLICLMSVLGANISCTDRVVDLPDFNMNIVVPKQTLESSFKTQRYGGTKVYYFDMKHMSYDGTNISVLDQPAPATMLQYKADALATYKKMSANVNLCEISNDGKQFILDVSNVVIFNKKMKFFQKAILTGGRLILATGTCASDMDDSEIEAVKRATFSLQNTFSMSESEKELTLRSALKGINGDLWNSMGSERGFKLIMSLARSGYAPAQVELGHIYAFGKKPFNGGKDMCQAVYWYSKAADQGNAEAQNSLGVCYANGTGVKKNPDRALQLYRLSAKGGNAFAIFNLGNYYAKEGDFREAKEYYLRAAAKDHPSAMYNLGMIYYEGKGVTKDIDEAVYWFERASALDEPRAQNNLGWILARGENGVVDTERAIVWFKKAAAKGVDNARKSLKYIKEHGSLLRK